MVFMSRTVEVPVTPSVLRWAIDESGYELEQVAYVAGVNLSELERWLSGQGKPTLTSARKIAQKLHRPLASLLLPEPPRSHELAVAFRHPSDYQRSLNPEERRSLRRAGRLQEVLSWLVKELDLTAPEMTTASTSHDPVAVAARIREAVGVSVSHQKRWNTTSDAFDGWRSALERAGYMVFLVSIGRESVNGFSLWDQVAPVVAVNTARNEASRIFTLFHELGHLVTKTSSACLEAVRAKSRTDPVERWCEQFAAELLMPSGDVRKSLKELGTRAGMPVTELRPAQQIAALYKVSLRAAVIRLIEVGIADWSLYDQIPALSDGKRPGGGGGGRDRAQIREDQVGDRVTSLLLAAVESDLLNRSQVVTLLDIPDAKFEALSEAKRRSG
jgi:Zn-dependent peptidase ImmA (M78 family)/transcriptional regulator with XRE-family HTH domain